MTKLYQIDKDVPLPKVRPHGTSEHWIDLAKTLAYGDSTLVANNIEASLLRDAGVHVGKKIISRRQRKINAVRCWMIGER